MPYLQSVRCKFCGSSNIIRYGKQKNKQVYKCKSCERKFVPNKGFEKMGYEPKIIAVVMDLYFKGTSYRKITDHLRQFYGVSVDHSTAYRWVKKYIAVIEEYAMSLKPCLGNVWHGDEMQLNVGGQIRWLWNIMDKKTRYQLVEIISRGRKTADAQKAFRQSKEAGKKKPKLI